MINFYTAEKMTEPTIIYNEAEVNDMLSLLRTSIELKDRKRILELYDKLNEVDWNTHPDSLFNCYDNLVTEGNDILYS